MPHVVSHLVNLISDLKWVRKWAILSRAYRPGRGTLIPNDLPAISGQPWEIAANPPPIRATLFLPLIADKDFLDFFAF